MNVEFSNTFKDSITRRLFIGRSAQGLGGLVTTALIPSVLGSSSNKMSGFGGLPHHTPKAKRVIWLTMAGGPSQFETFDYKPRLVEMHGKPMPESMTRGQQIAQLQGKPLLCYAPQYDFTRFGKCGAEICTLFPHIGSIADDICIVRSMTTDAINHDPAQLFMNCGSQLSGRPSMGSWIVYGLGSESRDLPGFMVLTSVGSKENGGQPIASKQWSSGFLPGQYQGVQLRSKGDPVLYLNTPAGSSIDQQRDLVAAINAINSGFASSIDDPEIATRIAQYEMAFRMQTSVPELTDLSKETAKTLEMYGCQSGERSFATNCLLARRLIERGVRFIQLYHRDWDHHQKVKEGMRLKAQETDRACWALILDLKERGLLEDTIVVWAGEFGRTPMSQDGNGRDHHNKGFSLWMAGGGVVPGVTYGATDELGYAAVQNIVSMHDLHATLLHLLGIDHERFTYRYQGVDAKLTSLEPARVIHDILL